MNNPLIQEVREAREKWAAKFDFDLHRIFEDGMNARQQRPPEIAASFHRSAPHPKPPVQSA